MKYVRLMREGAPVWGILEGESIRTLSKPPYEELSYDGKVLELKDCKLLAPCEPTKLVCIGRNYYEHIAELRSMEDSSGTPEQPTLFLKGLNCLNHPEGHVQTPEFVTRLDYEGELGVVIKKRAKNVKAEDFADYVLGYTCLNDVTARDIQKADGQWARGKSMDGFAPIGPLVTDEIDPANADIETRLNGKVVQKSNTSLFITSVAKIVEFITASMTLEPGDVIATGTPAGVGPMKSGDVVEVEVKGVGVLRTHID